MGIRKLRAETHGYSCTPEHRAVEFVHPIHSMKKLRKRFVFMRWMRWSSGQMFGLNKISIPPQFYLHNKEKMVTR